MVTGGAGQSSRVHAARMLMTRLTVQRFQQADYALELDEYR